MKVFLRKILSYKGLCHRSPLRYFFVKNKVLYTYDLANDSFWDDDIFSQWSSNFCKVCYRTLPPILSRKDTNKKPRRETIINDTDVRINEKDIENLFDSINKLQNKKMGNMNG